MSNLYWHFAAIKNGHPVMRDGTLIEVGTWYEINGDDIMLCKTGYHGSRRAIDALYYAPGPWVSRRPLKGAIDYDDKSVGSAFIQLPGIDATKILRDFFRWCAFEVIDNWEAPDIVRLYLETGDESIRSAAWSAAWYAAAYVTNSMARGAAINVARYTAISLAWYAANYSVWSTTKFAAESMTESMAKFAAESMVSDVQNAKLESMLLEVLEEVETDYLSRQDRQNDLPRMDIRRR